MKLSARFGLAGQTQTAVVKQQGLRAGPRFQTKVFKLPGDLHLHGGQLVPIQQNQVKIEEPHLATRVIEKHSSLDKTNLFCWPAVHIWEAALHPKKLQNSKNAKALKPQKA